MVLFFSRMKKHERFNELETACMEWWAEHMPGKRAKKALLADAEEDPGEPSFLAFTQMMGI